MKRSFFKIFLCLSIGIQASLSPAFSLSLNGFEAAENLANDNIIVKKYDTNGYQLEKPIVRQEATAIIGKASGSVIGDDSGYVCRRMFSDVREGWVCRSVEIAADAGIINKSNTKFRPKDKVSYFEAAVMALKSSCINPNHSLKGNTDQERVLERIREAGVSIDSKNKDKSITRGEFFQYIVTVRNFTNEYPDEVDLSQPSCQKGENYSTDNFDLNLPINWNKPNEEALSQGQTHGVFFDDSKLYTRLYVREYNINIKPGEFYDNSKKSQSEWAGYKFLSEKDGPMGQSKIVRFQFRDETNNSVTENYTYFAFSDGKALELTFAYDPLYFNKFYNLMEKIFASAKNKQTVVTTPTPVTPIPTTPQKGDIVYINFKKNSGSGRIGTTGSSVFPLGTEFIPEVLQDVIITMKIGETRTVQIPASKAYGEKYSEIAMTPSEFEKFKAQVPLGSLQKTTKMNLIGVDKKTISKEAALAIFGDLVVGKEVKDANITNKIIEVNASSVVTELINPNALFYNKTVNVGDAAFVDDTSFTVQTINGDEVVLLTKFTYTIVTESDSQVIVRVKNTHPFAGESLTYEITLTNIKKMK